MCLDCTFKHSFLCVATFQLITTVVNKDKSFQFSNVPHIGLLWYLNSEEILLKERVDQLMRILVYFADCANQKYDNNNSKDVQKLAPFYIPCHMVLSFLHGLLLKAVANNLKLTLCLNCVLRLGSVRKLMDAKDQ